MDSWTDIRLDTPGASFADSFLLGNGHLGASLGFQPDRESVLLSHTAFWSGAPPQTHGRSGAPEAFRRARALSLRGDYAAAYDALEGFIGLKENYGTNLPVARLVITQFLGPRSDYTRSLSMVSGQASCAFRHGLARQTRRVRCLEHPAVLEMEFRDTEPMRIAFSLEGPCVTSVEAAGDTLWFEARALETVHSDGCCGVSLAGALVLAADGPVRAGEGALQAEGRLIRLRLAMETDYVLSPSETPPDRETLRSRVRASVRQAGEDPAPLPVRITLPGQERVSRQALFGHYLLRAALSPDSPLPPNLQGVWNDEEACRLGWTNDFHLDVNTQMNLSCAETLGEGHRLAPLFRFMRDRLIPEGLQTARGYYGLPGAVAELTTNAFGYAAPYWGRPLAPCPACGFWLCGLVIRSALCHPEDQRFLRETALPLLRPFVEFALAYVTKDAQGHAIGGPAISPENGFLVADSAPDDSPASSANGSCATPRTVYAAMGTTFENEQLRILLHGYGEICRLLGISDDTTTQARQVLSNLPPIRVDARGGIAEYPHDLPLAVPHHRHMSHLSGLVPGDEIRPEHPHLAQAAERTIRSRVQPEEAFESTPWARVMLGLYEARLGHGDEALAHLEYMLSHHGTPSLLMMHPPIPGTLNPRPVWELDGNTGFTEVVLEMLVQSDRDGHQLRLLPALPEKWSEGRLEGIQAGPWRLVELSWQSPDTLHLRLRGSPGTPLSLLWQGKTITKTLPADGELTLTEKDWE